MFFLCLSSSSLAYGGGLGSLLSPGELSKAHAKYEGIKNCTLCHKIGRGVTDANCLDCHDKLAKKIENNKGAHSKYTDICITCHLEHLGRGHQLVSMDEEKFKHEITGYDLADKHSKLLCSKCHRRQNSYGGLISECISCHKDEHKKQLNRKCEKCHDPSGWKEPKGFVHNRDSDFTIKGAHRKVDCAKCHVKGRFKPIKYDTCGTALCHGDRHKGQFTGKKCEQCHNEDFSNWGVSLKEFDHDSAAFKLKKAHLKVKCAKCHVKGRFKPIKFKTCGTALCHGDRHKGQFKGKKCEQCHKDDFSNWGVSLKEFDHDSAAYSLTGKHLDVECIECHVKGRFKPLEYKSCGTALCHGDRHKGQFEGKECKECHNDDSSNWKIFPKFSHNKDSVFALKGKHFDLECSKCHTQGRYKPIEHKGCGTEDCHGKEHSGEFKDKECTNCHDPGASGFDVSKFMDHKRESGFALTGLHAPSYVECKDCHVTEEYRGIGKGCYTCHREDDEHENTLGEKCERCHLPEDWIELNFDHNKDTNFLLEKDHKGVDCEDCHLSLRFGEVSSNCFDCHRK